MLRVRNLDTLEEREYKYIEGELYVRLHIRVPKAVIATGFRALSWGTSEFGSMQQAEDYYSDQDDYHIIER